MATQRVRCSACGFAALLRRTGESIKLTIDSAKQIQVCDHLSHESQTNSRRLAPLDCRAFRDTVQILANSWKPSTPTFVKDAESKESGFTEATVERIDEEVGSSQTSRDA